ncbi:hypothetical protein BN871_AS_00090 [Paenibacillus sp. P22]|nr:hypothetical protein BN871_AS_00090 [Paenibacillus sp. P22]
MLCSLSCFGLFPSNLRADSKRHRLFGRMTPPESGLLEAFQEPDRFGDILFRLCADFPLDRQVTGISDVLKRLEVIRPVDAALAKRNFTEVLSGLGRCRQRLMAHRLVAEHAVYFARVDFPQPDAVLGMRMDDVILQRIDALDRIVSGHHHHIGRIEVDGQAVRAERIEELPQMGGALRTGLDREVSVDAAGIAAQLLAGALHRVIDLAVLVIRHDADVGRDDRAAEIHRQVENPLGLLDLPAVLPGVLEAVSGQVAHKGGNLQAEGSDVFLELPAAGGIHDVGIHFALDRIDLHAVRSDFLGLQQPLTNAELEAVHDDADRIIDFSHATYRLLGRLSFCFHCTCPEISPLELRCRPFGFLCLRNA